MKLNSAKNKIVAVDDIGLEAMSGERKRERVSDNEQERDKV
jgi:hypothetical protein